MVNWFRKGKDGKFLWPGFGENMRVLKWIVDRARGSRRRQETLFGWVPKAGDLDLSGLDMQPEAVDEATHIDLDEWKEELESQKEFFDKLGTTLPRPIALQRELLLERVKTARQVK